MTLVYFCLYNNYNNTVKSFQSDGPSSFEDWVMNRHFVQVCMQRRMWRRQQQVVMTMMICLAQWPKESPPLFPQTCPSQILCFFSERLHKNRGIIFLHKRSCYKGWTLEEIIINFEMKSWVGLREKNGSKIRSRSVRSQKYHFNGHLKYQGSNHFYITSRCKLKDFMTTVRKSKKTLDDGQWEKIICDEI